MKIFMLYCLILIKLSIQSFTPKQPKQQGHNFWNRVCNWIFFLSIILSHLLKKPLSTLLLLRPDHLLNKQWKVLITHVSNALLWLAGIMSPTFEFHIISSTQWIHTSCYLDVIYLFIHIVEFIMAIIFYKLSDHNVLETL